MQPVELFQHVEAIHPGHFDIQEDQFWPVLTDRLDPLFRRTAHGSDIYGRSVGFQQPFQHFETIVLVIDDYTFDHIFCLSYF
ncbi:hypothetical protein D3C86_1965070 [compost metagenome]